MRVPLLLGVFLATVAADVLNINKGVIVHLFEWRWVDVAEECEDFLAHFGFAGVQISPPNENIIVNSPPRPWWERYQPISYKLTTRSGNEEELRDMVRRCNKVGVRVFADAVLNHMTSPLRPPYDAAEGTGGSTADPLAYSYPAVPFTKDDFHIPECTVNNFHDANNVRNCEVNQLRDLDGSKPNVREKQLQYLNKLIDMGFAGFRIDSAKYMWPADLKYLIDGLHNLNTEHGFLPKTRPFIYLEVEDKGGEAIHWDEYSPLGLVTDFRYEEALGNTFLAGEHDLTWLKNIGTNGDLLPDNVAVVFIENHETQRKDKLSQLNYKVFRPYKMALSFMLAYPWGTPRLLSSFYFDGYDQGPPREIQYHTLPPDPETHKLCANQWVCEHRWRQAYNMVHFHNVVAGTEVKNWWDNGKDQIAFCRGDKGFIAFNKETTKLSQKLQTCLPKGRYCDVISGMLKNNECTGKTVEVEEDGTGLIEINPYYQYDPNVENDGVMALHVKAKILDQNDLDRIKAEAAKSEGKQPAGGSTTDVCHCSGSSGSGVPACDSLKSLLLEGSRPSTSLLGQSQEDLAILKLKIRKLEKILDLLLLI